MVEKTNNEQIFFSKSIEKKPLNWYEVVGMSYFTLFSITFGTADLIWIIIFVGLLVLPTVFILLANLWWWIRSWRLRYTKDIIILIWEVINVGLIIVLHHHQTYAHDMETLYERHHTELEELCQYARASVPPNTYYHLEFDADTLNMLHIQAPGDTLIGTHWGDSEDKKDSLMQVIRLSPQRLENIKKRLKRLGCIGITIGENSHTTVIDYKRVLLGMYSFRLFDYPITDKDYQYYLDSISTIPYSRKVIFEYRGGAIGSDNFPGKEEYLKDRIKQQTIHDK